jgi:tripartite-type tricarboxylate transporter receptor subunit TctC
MIKKILSILFFFVSSSAMAHDFKLIMMNPVGSLPDQWGRKISQLVKEQSNINLTVLNVAGGGGLVAAMSFKKETVAATITNSSQLVYLPLHNQETPYNESDFDIISPLGLTGVVWFTHATSGINTLDDLIKVLPKMDKGAIGVGAGDGQANALALTRLKKLDVPVVNFKNASEMVIQVVGKHVPVGVAAIAQDTIWSMAESKQIKLLGVAHSDPSFTYRGFTLPSINQRLNIPVFYSGAWLAVTPGNSEQHLLLKDALLKALKDKDLQEFTKTAWPYGNIAPLSTVKATATKHKELLKND